jgi:hypothetical protein
MTREDFSVQCGVLSAAVQGNGAPLYCTRFKGHPDRHSIAVGLGFLCWDSLPPACPPAESTQHAIAQLADAEARLAQRDAEVVQALFMLAELTAYYVKDQVAPKELMERISVAIEARIPDLEAVRGSR